MKNLIFAFIALFALAAFAPAQVVVKRETPAPIVNADRNIQLPAGERITDARGRTVANTGQRGRLTVRLNGRITNNGGGSYTTDGDITSVTVGQGAESAEIDADGIEINLNNSGSSITVSSDNNTVNVNGDGTTADYSGTNTTVNIDSGAKNGTTNCNAGSEGTINYERDPGTVNFNAGSGQWQLRRG